MTEFGLSNSLIEFRPLFAVSLAISIGRRSACPEQRARSESFGWPVKNVVHSQRAAERIWRRFSCNFQNLSVLLIDFKCRRFRSLVIGLLKDNWFF